MMKLTREHFLEIAITPEMLARAKAKADEMGELKNSIRRGTGNLAGFLGEEIVLAAWEGSVSHNTYQHDLTYEEVTFEVKTKDRTVAPRLGYEASVANFNTRQTADFYVFVSLYRIKETGDYARGYIIGIIAKESYKEQAAFLKVGDIDPSNGWKVSADCYNLPYDQLARFEGWEEILENDTTMS
jgi:hypothetical protein